MRYGLKMVLVAFHVQVNRLYLKHSTRRITKLGSGEGLRTLQLWQSAKIYLCISTSHWISKGATQSPLERRGLPVHMWIRPSHSLRKLNSGQGRKTLGILWSLVSFESSNKNNSWSSQSWPPKGILVSSSQVMILSGNVFKGTLVSMLQGLSWEREK